MNGINWWLGSERCWVDDLLESDSSLHKEIDDWWDTSSPEPMVGSRHHTVPRFYLDRFATSGQLRLRDRVTGAASLRSISKLAIRDFYTFINIDGERDGRLEHVLSVMESGAKEVFDRLLDPFQMARALTASESLRIALFLAFQLLRTPRHRREVELMGDYVAKITNRHVPGIGQVRIVPDPNLHLDYMCKSAFKISEVFYCRPTMLLTIDQPLFITCDEPVILRTDGDENHVVHLPNCAKSERRRKKDGRRPSRHRRRKANTVHAYPTRPGAAQAVELALPLSPRALLVLGPMGARGPLQRQVTGAEAIEIAEGVNDRLVAQAYEWVAANPAHPTFPTMPWPEPEPIVRVCDGGSPFARDLDRPPSPRRPELLGRRGWR